MIKSKHFAFSDSNIKFSFASYYNDHMVLQRGPKSAVIWGYSPVIGGTVLVTMGTKQYQSFVFKSGVPGVGIWRVKLDPVYEHGPFDIIASSADGENILLSDVLFGDVWLCSGQSNMVFSVGLVCIIMLQYLLHLHWPLYDIHRLKDSPRYID